jgi:hypothetical protein
VGLLFAPRWCGWIIELQAQVTYQNIELDDASDGAATVSFSDVNSLIGRLGARLARSWELDPGETDPRQITGWLRASLSLLFPGRARGHLLLGRGAGADPCRLFRPVDDPERRIGR